MAREPHDTPQDAAPEESPRAGGILGAVIAAVRRQLADPLKLAIILGVNAAIVTGIVSTALILRSYKPPPKPVTLQMALAAMDRDDDAEAQRMAERLAVSRDISTSDWGGPDFILGVIAMRAAEKAEEKPRDEALHLAAIHLERAHERGFPAGREATGLYLLGKCLSACDHLVKALPVLEQAMKENPQRNAELRLLLIQAHLGAQPPQWDEALADSRSLLADPRLTKTETHQTLLLQAEILLGMNRLDEAAAAIRKVPDNASVRGDISLLTGRLTMLEGLAARDANSDAAGPSPKAKEKLRQAVEILRRAIAQDAGENRIARRASYLIGLCLMEQGDLPAALSQMERTAKLYPESAEHLAALFQQGEIARRMNRHAEAVSGYRRVLSAYAKLEEFRNPWITASQLKTKLLDVWREYLKAEKYETALLLGKSWEPLIPKVEALTHTVQLHHAWAENLLEQAKHAPQEKAEELRRQARFQLRRAGDAHAAIARELFATKQYPDQLWNAADAYLNGHDFRSAAAMIRAYMRNEVRLRRAQALVDLGRAELCLGDPQRALQSCQECIHEHPRDIAVYQARLLASRAAAALGDSKQAEAFLLDNLRGDQLTPASKEWRESLLALAELLHDNGRDREAIQRLDEFVQRYPEAAEAVPARYLMADSARRRAVALRAGAAKEISSALRNERMAEVKRLLGRALDAYGLVQDQLGRRDARDLSEQEKALLRNARFALGDVYFEMQRYPEALRAYQSAANHYAASPVVLDAYLQISNVYRRLDRPAEARTSLEQARLALRRLPPEARFEKTTSYSRQQWGELLDRLCSL